MMQARLLSSHVKTSQDHDICAPIQRSLPFLPFHSNLQQTTTNCDHPHRSQHRTFVMVGEDMCTRSLDTTYIMVDEDMETRSLDDGSITADEEMETRSLDSVSTLCFDELELDRSNAGHLATPPNSSTMPASTASATATAADPDPTSFHSCAPELRNEVYALVDEMVIVQCSKCLITRRRKDPDPQRQEFLQRQRGKEVTQQAPKLHHHAGCEPYTKWGKAYLWLNRNSHLSIIPGDAKKIGSTQKPFVGARHLYVDHRVRRQCPATAAKHATEHTVPIHPLPAITHASKKVRQEALGIFYGNHHFFFTYFAPECDEVSILGYLKTIGLESASLMTELTIVYRSRDDWRYIEKKLVPEMKKLGIKEDVVVLRKLEYPYCNCERCIVRVLEKPVADEPMATNIRLEDVEKDKNKKESEEEARMNAMNVLVAALDLHP
jgi:hypothetical protein